MPRVFTENEREYIADLVARNRDPNYHGDPEKGAEQPMSGSERVKRHRIREKARITLHDLAMVAEAGLFENDLTREVSQARRAARGDIDMLDDEGERWWYAMGGDEWAEAEDVEIR